MKIGVIVQARMGSTRFPGKVMKKLCDKEVLWHVVERLKKSIHVNDVIIATTEKQQDEIIAEFCEKHSVKCFRGDELDVLKRYYDAANSNKLDIIVRVTSDCPLIDPTVVDRLIEMLIEEDLEYVSNSFEKTYAKGLECSAFTFKALERCMREAVKPEHREHVVLYMRENPTLFATAGICNLKDDSDFRITLDEEDDYKLLSIIYNHLYIENEIIPVEEVLEFINNNNLKIVNAHVEQKS